MDLPAVKCSPGPQVVFLAAQAVAADVPVLYFPSMQPVQVVSSLDFSVDLPAVKCSPGPQVVFLAVQEVPWNPLAAWYVSTGHAWHTSGCVVDVPLNFSPAEQVGCASQDDP